MPEEHSSKTGAGVLTLATKGRRFLNLILDYVGALIFAFVFGISTALIGLQKIIEINKTLLGIILIFLYYLICESLWQKTLGKLITRTKVVMIDGSKPDFKHILGRTVSRFIPFEAFSFLGQLGWHDKLSNTRVVMNNVPSKITVVSDINNVDVLTTSNKHFCSNCGGSLDENAKFCGLCGRPIAT